MIAGLSKAINQYLAPLLSLTSILLILFAFLAPTVMLEGKVALLTVGPSTSLTQPGSSGSIDGPSVFLGPLGSCTRRNLASSINCTLPAINPTYDLSVLPGSAPDLLSAPTATTPAFIAVSIAFTFFFLLLFTLTAFRSKMGKAGAFFDKPVVQRSTAWIGLFGFMIGLTSFLVLRMWFGKSVEDFNKAILKGGQSSPQLVADLSNGFTMIYVAYAFYAIPLVSSLAKLHVTSTGKA
ncbi:hypothetical protein NLI96_g8717 [Meripilus lineatus]|uniref:Uncharacterized protein n=1 Tax=Meripilus lineatus TaxID=2056292 RepID=A0AAD5YDQ4_9APHY|nr:hypothetical protein NLI96_g8717 [Physisporinus lineatus]